MRPGYDAYYRAFIRDPNGNEIEAASFGRNDRDAARRARKGQDMMRAIDDTAPRIFYHGTRADLRPGDLLAPGFNSNYQERKLSWIYFSATLDAAIWGAELAKGDARERIYIVEPTGDYFDDPNLTDKKFPGNPTQSYRSRAPLRVAGEVADWEPHSPERLKEMKDFLARLEAEGDMRIVD